MPIEQNTREFPPGRESADRARSRSHGAASGHAARGRGHSVTKRRYFLLLICVVAAGGFRWSRGHSSPVGCKRLASCLPASRRTWTAET